ncbi:MAG: cation diffusion facilitator family transporter [Sulfurovaceae bacterium]|nr:cation diffusion facilitator family transporter [Sulfurovaceae bacterium]
MGVQISSQKKATIISSSTAFLLVCIKFTAGLLSGSVAVLASAIDSSLDFIVSMFNFFAIKKAEEDPTSNFQYGKGKIQGIAAVIEGTVISLSGLYIIYEAIKKIVTGGKTELLGPSIIIMIFSISITFFLVRYLLHVADKTANIVIKSDALHYSTDLWSNGVTLLALVSVWITGENIIDAIFGFGIGVYIIYSASEIIIDGTKILLDHALPEDEVDTIHSILDKHPEITSYHWLKTRTNGSVNFVEFHMVLQPNMLLLEAHRIADQVEKQIMAIDPLKKWVITPHFDPYDDKDINDALFANGTI